MVLVLLPMTVAGCGVPDDEPTSRDSLPPATEQATAVTPAEWWQALCPEFLAADAAADVAHEATVEREDESWSIDEKAARDIAEIAALTDIMRGLAEALRSAPSVEALPLIDQVIDIRAERAEAIAEALDSLQDEMRAADNSEEVVDIREGRYEAKTVTKPYDEQIEALVARDESAADRAAAEFGIPLDSMPNCAEAWSSISS